MAEVFILIVVWHPPVLSHCRASFPSCCRCLHSMRFGAVTGQSCCGRRALLACGGHAVSSRDYVTVQQQRRASTCSAVSAALSVNLSFLGWPSWYVSCCLTGTCNSQSCVNKALPLTAVRPLCEAPVPGVFPFFYWVEVCFWFFFSNICFSYLYIFISKERL